ncbi:MAG TPA: prolyl oligopeptidase family serine peptidase [Hanamia sp.]|nr:prolyl oligopeptidase family serine peptidase [Hanamia sp.]
MSDPKWIGTSPSSPFWNADGSKLFFDWNPDNAPSDSLYYITKKNKVPVKATVKQKQNVVRADDIVYNVNRTAYVYEKNGDIFYKEVKSDKTLPVTETEETEYNPQFSFGGKEIVYNRDQNLFSWNITTGETRQLTNFINEDDKKKEEKLSPEDQWLSQEQIQYMQVLKKRKDKEDLTKVYDSIHSIKEFKKINIGDKSIRELSISPDGRFISYQLYQSPGKRKSTIVPHYITESGYTTEIPGRQKVGEPEGTYQFFIYDRKMDSVFEVKTDPIEGIRDIPEFMKDYPTELARRKKENALRSAYFASAKWSPEGTNLVLDIRAQDHKDRWLMLWDTATKKLKLLDRQHDSAWIGGPGIWNTGWINENDYWYQSEVTGFSHLYSVNVITGKKKNYTSGKYEVLDEQLSSDKKYFYITTNEIEPAQHQFYRLRITDNTIERITTMTGGNEVTISPDEKTIAILYSYTNKPWELYLQENRAGAKPEQITRKAESAEFKSYPWRDPEIFTFAARDGALVHGRVYKPTHPDIHKPAVIFVHGAGYLQNIDKWWSDYYFREMMFNNLLADHGYYVMDVDYRGSAGYGRDWRTAIYRHMGGKDLTDNVDAANYLVKTYGVDPKRIGIYGGSYGGFITLMAMFTTPDVFAAGSGQRSVSDWANYNNGYTSEILNKPYEDSLAYKRSSPIYFVDGLKGHLLMCHGMVDQNVHFQDIVKVTERLIELGKDNWELAPYPMENHDFEDPSSWTDEYKRIYKLFEEVLKK